MQSELIFLLEERSIEEMLKIILPKVIGDIPFKCLPHEGKQDLLKSIPRKLRAWNTPGAYFVVVIDKDRQDCVQLKQQLVEMFENSGRENYLARIIIHELENWFLGDLQAVGNAFKRNALAKKQRAAKFRLPDTIANASEELKKIVPEYQKISGARAIASYMDINQNCSESFNQFLTGLKKLCLIIS